MPNPNLNNPLPNGAASVDFPLWSENDTEFLEVTQKYIVKKTEYRRIPLNSKIDLSEVNLTDTFVYPNISNAFFVHETKPLELGFNLVQFERTWVTTPKNKVDYSSYTYVFPGRLDNTEFFSYDISANDVERKFRTDNGTVVRINGDFEEIDVGTSLKVYIDGRDYRFWYKVVVVKKTATYIEFPSRYLSIVRIEGDAPIASPQPRTVGAEIVVEYFNTLKPESIPIRGSFFIVDGATGALTDILTNTSSPTIAQYDSLEKIVVSPTVIKPFRGWKNLWEASTTYVSTE